MVILLFIVVIIKNAAKEFQFLKIQYLIIQNYQFHQLTAYLLQLIKTSHKRNNE